MSPEFQLGQVYDGTFIEDESVLLYRPVYVRVPKEEVLGRVVSTRHPDYDYDEKYIQARGSVDVTTLQPSTSSIVYVNALEKMFIFRWYATTHTEQRCATATNVDNASERHEMR